MVSVDHDELMNKVSGWLVPWSPAVSVNFPVVYNDHFEGTRLYSAAAISFINTISCSSEIKHVHSSYKQLRVIESFVD
jgi:type 1 fimbria pilin